MHLLDRALGDEAITAYTRSARDSASRNSANTPVLDSVSSAFNGVTCDASLHCAYNMARAFALYTDTETYAVSLSLLSDNRQS